MSASALRSTTRRTFLRDACVAGLVGLAGCLGGEDGSGVDRSGAPGRGVMYKGPGCACCDQYATYLAEHGHGVDVRSVANLDAVKAGYGVPAALDSCHTMVLAATGYVVEGHVPIPAIELLLADRPNVVGIALPGMPAGSPGMGGSKSAPFVVYAIEPDGAFRPYLEV